MSRLVDAARRGSESWMLELGLGILSSLVGLALPWDSSYKLDASFNITCDLFLNTCWLDLANGCYS